MKFPVLISRRSFCASALMIAAAAFTCAAAKQDTTPCFTDSERDAIRSYWNQEGRYTVLPSDADERINVTIEGSTWWLAASKVIAAQRKIDPATADQWQEWWDSRVAQQKAIATKAASVPADPGPIPSAFAAACSTSCPTMLYETVQPVRYTVTFAPEDAPEPFVYEDGIDFGKRSTYYGYYRQKNGVIRPGRKVRDIGGDEKKRLDAIFAKAGRSGFERRVLQAVSQYEGGFEAINTYDTGFVSIGFIQFITAVDGQGSLAEVLQYYKTNDKDGFQKDFRRFGIDVSPIPALVCVDPVTGQEVRGVDAVRRVIDDKRLTAVFERAAAGDGFKLAQVSVARSHYWPGEDVLSVVVQDKQVVSATLIAAGSPLLSANNPDAQTCTVADIVKSEAGMATLMDKKVNRGNIRDFADVARQVMIDNGLTNPRDLSKYERNIIAVMKYRGDFLADPNLTQPTTLRSKSQPTRTVRRRSKSKIEKVETEKIAERSIVEHPSRESARSREATVASRSGAPRTTKPTERTRATTRKEQESEQEVRPRTSTTRAGESTRRSRKIVRTSTPDRDDTKTTRVVRKEESPSRTRRESPAPTPSARRTKVKVAESRSATATTSTKKRH